MSKERQKARAAREVARKAEVEAAAARRAKQARRKALATRVAPPRRQRQRQRRYGALSARARYQFVVAFLVVQALAWYLFDSLGRRFSVAVLTVAVLLVLVRTRRRTPR